MYLSRHGPKSPGGGGLLVAINTYISDLMVRERLNDPPGSCYQEVLSLSNLIIDFFKSFHRLRGELEPVSLLPPLFKGLDLAL